MSQTLGLLVAAAEPAREAALGLGSAVLDLAVEFVDGLHGLGLGLLRIGLGIALCYGDLLVGLGCLE